MATVATRVVSLLHQMTPALCLDCLARVIDVPRATMGDLVGTLLRDGRLKEAPAEWPCQICRKPALMVPRVE